MNTADRRALEARDRLERSLGEGTKYTLGWLLDEVDDTRPAGMDEAQAIRTLVEERVERYLFSRSEADKVLDMLDSEASKPLDDDRRSLTDILRARVAKEDE